MLAFEFFVGAVIVMLAEFVSITKFSTALPVPTVSEALMLKSPVAEIVPPVQVTGLV